MRKLIKKNPLEVLIMSSNDLKYTLLSAFGSYYGSLRHLPYKKALQQEIALVLAQKVMDKWKIPISLESGIISKEGKALRPDFNISFFLQRNRVVMSTLNFFEKIITSDQSLEVLASATADNSPVDQLYLVKYFQDQFSASRVQGKAVERSNLTEELEDISQNSSIEENSEEE